MAKGLSHESLLRRRLLENMAFLLSITEKPEDASRNETSLGNDDGHRQLDPEHERRLAGDLAFLAATTDDPNKVMAVGLEEHPDGRGLTIRVATNTGVLRDTLPGLRAIANTLEQAATRGKTSS